MKPTVGAVVIVGALLTFGSMATLVGSCGREEAKMEGKSEEAMMEESRKVVREQLHEVLSQVESTTGGIFIAVLQDAAGVSIKMAALGAIEDPRMMADALLEANRAAMKALRAADPCDCPDCRANRADTSSPFVVIGTAPGSAHGPLKDN